MDRNSKAKFRVIRVNFGQVGTCITCLKFKGNKLSFQLMKFTKIERKELIKSLGAFRLSTNTYSQTCVKRPYKTIRISGFSDRWLLIAV